jgi:hypothetical protein
MYIFYLDLLSHGSGTGLPLPPPPPGLGLGSAAMELSRLVGERSLAAAGPASDPGATLPPLSRSVGRGDGFSSCPKEGDEIRRSSGDTNALRQNRETNGGNSAADTR